VASIAIPLASAFAPEIIAGVEGIVRHIEQLFGHKTGAVKLPTATTWAKSFIDGLTALGAKVPTSDQPSVQALVQQVVDALNLNGQLKGAATSLTPILSTPPFAGTVSGNGTQTLPPISGAGDLTIAILQLLKDKGALL